MNKELKPIHCLFHNLHYKTHPFSPFPTKPLTFLTDSPPNRFILINFTKFSSKSVSNVCFKLNFFFIL
ncbi:hypothetical protein HanPI659440_Chr13g0482431 [Helianthus annuus]|nr:hypothetical protein HanPI659440_Chr13g0482431 [Helianthus annuus]